jgi:hypothetical protein
VTTAATLHHEHVCSEADHLREDQHLAAEVAMPINPANPELPVLV